MRACGGWGVDADLVLRADAGVRQGGLESRGRPARPGSAHPPDDGQPSHPPPLPVGQGIDKLLAALFDCLRAGAIKRVFYYELLDTPRSNLRDCFHPMDGKQPVSERTHLRAQVWRGMADAGRDGERGSVLGAVEGARCLMRALLSARRESSVRQGG